MKRLGIVMLFIAAALMLTAILVQMTSLGPRTAGGISAIAALLVFLMLDLKPEGRPGDATIIRLTRGSWQRKRK
jgi:hypothetical protein